MAFDDLPQLVFANGAAWEAWLERHHATADGVAIRMAKKDSGIASIAYPDVLDIALCFGWIDGRRSALDERWYLQQFSPRRARSRWSRNNREKAEALMEAGRMRPAGIDEVERARADGRWEAAYDGQRTMTVPEDLQLELDARPHAAEFFAGLSSQNRYSILYRLHDAKRPETRARRLATFVAMLEAGETIY